jgi:DNA-binding MarR family transcriptional regulator
MFVTVDCHIRKLDIPGMIGSGEGKRKEKTTLPQSRIAYAIGRLERVVRQSLGVVTRRFGLTVAQYTALSVLQARGELSNAQLARRSFVTPQAMNEILKAMTASGMVARRPHARHGRIVQIALTAKGERILRRCDAAARRVELAMLVRLSPAERTRLRERLWTCIAALEALEAVEAGGAGTKHSRRGGH